MVTAWYWRHEHDCILYDRHAEYGLFGRCIGNGGIPSPRKAEVIAAELYRSVNGVAWKRLSATRDSPACIALDGPNPFVTGEETTRRLGLTATFHLNSSVLIYLSESIYRMVQRFFAPT